MPILNPEFQFIRVLTIWGLFIYVLFFLNFRCLSLQPYIIAGMLAPIFTVFNPVYVDLFLRLDDSTTLWRMCYSIPLHFVGGWVAVHCLNNLIKGSGILAKSGSFATLTLLFALLLPLNIGNWQNAYARTTLGRVSEANDYRQWIDILRYLNTLPQRETILTDPVTGYVTSALTPHRTFHYKFFSNRQYTEHWKKLSTPELDFQGSLQNMLLLVNLRDGGTSHTGKRAQHWQADILAVSRHYHETLLKRIVENPGKFHLLWSQDRIALYRIAFPEP